VAWVVAAGEPGEQCGDDRVVEQSRTARFDLSLGYSYFTNGLIQQITNNLSANKTEKYAYDDLRRLLTAQLGPDSGIVRKYQYNYDRYWNGWGQNVVAGSGYNAMPGCSGTQN